MQQSIVDRLVAVSFCDCCRGKAVANKAFSESEQEELASEEALFDHPQSELGRSRSPMAGWSGVLIGVGLGIAIAAGGTQLLPHTPAKPTAQPKPSQSQGQSVTVAQVESRPITQMINVTGTVAAQGDLIPVLPQTTGLQIKQVLVQEGQTVAAGVVLAVLDNSVLQAELDQANAQLESAQAVVGQKEATAAQAEAALKQAQQELKRYQTLAQSGAISIQDLSTRATTAVTDREAVRVAYANITSAKADVRNNAARVQQIRTQLAQTIVRSPVSGTIAEKIARVGDVTNGTQKLFSIIQNGLLEVQAQVPATQLPQVRTNAPALITSATDSRVRLQGRIRVIAPLVDPQSRQATVKIDLPPTSLLQPGLFVQAAIAANTVTGLTVPTQAVVSPTTGGHIVFLVAEDGTVHSQSVQVGEIVMGNRIEIKQGLEVGNRVAVAGAGFLNNGDRVQINSPSELP